MKSQTIIDWLNVFLILISLLIAIQLPFQLFIIAYAVLGPLHYLTEINWLDKKGYFILSKKRWSIVLIGFAIIISIFPLGSLDIIKSNGLISGILKKVFDNGAIMLIGGFLFATCLVYIKKRSTLFMALPLCLIIPIILKLSVPNIVLIIGALLPTIIHVYIFTLLFILYGTKKTKSFAGLINALLLLTVPFIIFYIDINPESYGVSESTAQDYESGNFQVANLMIANLLNIKSSNFSLLSAAGIKIQIFIAFAYTYHYLNWFSKTSVIGWNKTLTRKKTFIILFLWIISTSIYLYDFEAGFTILLLLSFLHVFLEFPLNATTIKGLIK